MPEKATLVDAARAAIGDLTAYRLASEAGCASPDSPTSPGAAMLESVRGDLLERIEYAVDGDEIGTADDLNDWANDARHEIADNAPDVYTYQRWQEFLDLAAWEVEDDAAELCGDDAPMTDLAGVCLYLIAETLVGALVEIVAEAWEELDDDDDDE